MQNSELQSELQLIERVKKGERRAFDSLVEKYKEKAFALSFNITGNYEDARDLLQEAFVKAYVNIKSFRGSSGFYTWFYRILVNLCRDHLRRKQRRSRVFAEPVKRYVKDEEMVETDAVDAGPDPSKAILNKEIQEMADKAINLLSEKQKIVFILKHIQGMKLNEIAQILNCSESTVKVHLFRATQSLQRSLSPYLSAKKEE